MNGIIVNTEQEAIDLINKIDDNIRELFNSGTSTYTYYKLNNTTGEIAVIIEPNDIEWLSNNYPEKLENIGLNYINDIVELDETWIDHCDE